MRNSFVRTLLVVLSAACCACAGTTTPAEAPALPIRLAASQVIKLYDVADLVTPSGDAGKIADLASQIREQVVFLHADLDPDAIVGSNGSKIVVVAVPAVHEIVARRLGRIRSGEERRGS